MDQLWVPILTHYRGGSVDPDRMGMHMRSLQPHVRSVLVAGSTGDGWDLDPRGFDEALEALRDAKAFSPQVEVLIGLLQPSTERVLARLDQVTAFLGRTAVAARIVGVAVCPPVDGDIDQAGIVRHFMAVIDASPSRRGHRQAVRGRGHGPVRQRVLQREPCCRPHPGIRERRVAKCRAARNDRRPAVAPPSAGDRRSHRHEAHQDGAIGLPVPTK